ncbi:MAG: SET domain-containing protein [Chitinophagaceae bacterium]|nr:SET domain-containing protein [Bacteroidota bacterium]MCC6257752.1 SET domain-containing protein [Chitinophagaceae bacterium]MCW5917830.1 SET domain-containing protein [Ferruginibacter sp.]
MNKEDLLNELKYHSKVMLKPSPIHGIGVFAIAPIWKGEKDIFSKNSQQWLGINDAELATLPQHAIRLIENYCLYDKDQYFVPEEGFKILDLVVFLNHSSTPNIQSLDDGLQFEAIRDISIGEELCIDYGSIVEEER